MKIFNAQETNFSTNGNIFIKPSKCKEIKKKSLNGWFIEVEIPIKYKSFIEKDKLCVVQTKSKIEPQAFRISDKIEFGKTKIEFKAKHVMFDAEDFFVLNANIANLNGLNVLNFVNGQTNSVSPFIINSDVSSTQSFLFENKTLFESWSIIEELWDGVFDFNNWSVDFKQNIGIENEQTIIYGQNLQGIKIFEDWSNVVTTLFPIGKNGLMLPEKFLESEIIYPKPYVKRVTFETSLENENQTEANLINELRIKASEYLIKNENPLFSYEVFSDVNQKLEIGDKIAVKHPLAQLQTEVLEYIYDLKTKKVEKIVFGNFVRDAKKRFDLLKEEIHFGLSKISTQEKTIDEQTNLINMLNKLGHVYIDQNEILILDILPLNLAINVLKIGLGGIGFSKTGVNGPFITAWTLDGNFNASFITAGTMNISRIQGLSDSLSNMTASIALNDQNITTTVANLNATAAVANTAQTTANTANTNANNALTQLSNITSDSVLSSDEKPDQRMAWNVIAEEKSSINSQATNFGITTENSNYNNAFQALANYLNNGTTWVSGIPLWLNDANLSVNTTIVGTTYRTTWETFYSTKNILLNAITARAKTLADTAQTTANTANTNSNNVSTTLTQVQTLANATSNNLTTLQNTTNILATTVNSNQTSLTQTANNLQVQITSMTTNGLSILRNTLVLINEAGVNVAKSGEQMNSTLSNIGVTVRRDTSVVLSATNLGVEAENIWVRNHLIIGANSRMENYLDGTGMFYVGGG